MAMNDPAPQATAAANARAGILYMLAAMAAFTLMDALSKQLVQTQAALQVVWGIYVVEAGVLGLIMARGLPRLLVTRRLGLQALRAALLVATSICFVTGLRHVPLAEAGAIVMLSPLAYTALAVPFLGEPMGVRRWLGVTLGFVGAMIIIRPGTEAMQLAALWPLAAAVLHGLYQVATRYVARDDNVLTTLIYSVLFCALIMTPVVPFHWTPLSMPQVSLLILAGICGALAEFTLIHSLARTKAAVVAPYTYSYLIWTALAGWVMFNERPDFWAILGAAVIVASGIYVWRRERAQSHQL